MGQEIPGSPLKFVTTDWSTCQVLRCLTKTVNGIESFQRSLKKSILQASVELKISPTTLHMILHKDCTASRSEAEGQDGTENFAETIMAKIDAGDTFLHRACFSDEAPFYAWKSQDNFYI